MYVCIGSTSAANLPCGEVWIPEMQTRSFQADETSRATNKKHLAKLREGGQEGTRRHLVEDLQSDDFIILVSGSAPAVSGSAKISFGTRKGTQAKA